MFAKIALFAFAMFAFAGAASAAAFDPIVCKAIVDAEAIVDAAVAEPSLELGSGEKTVALINDKIAGGLCAKAEDLDISLGNVAMNDAADGIKLGVAATNVGYAVVVEGILNF